MGKLRRTVLLALWAAATCTTIVSGALPAGLELDLNGTFRGTPTTEGVATFTVRALHSSGNAQRAFVIR